MEMHLVHRRPQDGYLAVVGIWLQVPPGVTSAIHDLRGQYATLDDLDDQNTSGEVNRLLHSGANPFLEKLNWKHMPSTAMSSVLPLGDDEDGPGAAKLLNVFDVLPFDQGYMTYKGSLTTPPCSEIVDWIMLKSTIPCSLAQKNAFVKIFGQNARPTQLLHGRNVTQTADQARGKRHCDREKQPEQTEEHEQSERDNQADEHCRVFSLTMSSLCSCCCVCACSTVSLIPTGVNHDLFVGVVGALIVVSLLLVFGVIFLCTRSQHRLARTMPFSSNGGYQMIGSGSSPLQQYGNGNGGGGGRGREHAYQAINPLDDELENGNRYRATAQANAQAAGGAAALTQSYTVAVTAPRNTNAINGSYGSV